MKIQTRIAYGVLVALLVLLPATSAPSPAPDNFRKSLRDNFLFIMHCHNTWKPSDHGFIRDLRYMQGYLQTKSQSTSV